MTRISRFEEIRLLKNALIRVIRA